MPMVMKGFGWVLIESQSTCARASKAVRRDKETVPRRSVILLLSMA
jgi:hypothetical protein